MLGSWRNGWGESKRGTKLLVGDGLIQKLCGVEARSLLNISIKIVYQIYKCEAGGGGGSGSGGGGGGVGSSSIGSSSDIS